MTQMDKNTEVAFRWIVNILRDNKIPFQISGGFAAKLYGSNRPLYDIDIDLPDKYFQQLESLVKDYVIFGPERYHDKNFDLLLMSLKYQGQEIDISGSETDQLYNVKTNQWEPCGTNIDDFTTFEAFGITVPVIKKENLIAYKQKVGRPTDLEDVEECLKLDITS